MAEFFLVGTYSEPILFGTGELFHGKGEGVYLCRLDQDGITRLSCLKLANPSFLAVDEGRRHIYAVNELKEFRGKYGGGLTDIVYDDRGMMTVAGTFNTDGGDPCHLAVSPDGFYLGTANFADGKVTVFRLDDKGKVTGEKTVFAHSGSSVHPKRQRGPHAHSIIFSRDGRMYVPDLGIDRLKAYRVSEEGVYPDDSRTVRVFPGSGPRFGEWSGDGKNFYLINELASSVTHLRMTDGGLETCSTVSTLPEDWKGDNICADLHLARDGMYLYASNRGHDSIAMFRVGQDGSLTGMGWISCGGRTPRNFAVDPGGTCLLVGNQDSDNITVFRIPEDGRLEMRFRTEFPTPVCIRFFEKTVF